MYCENVLLGIDDDASTEQAVRRWADERDMVLTSKKFWEVAADAIRYMAKHRAN